MTGASKESGKPVSMGTDAMYFGVLLGAGMIFGTALEKCRVFEPRNIRLQFLYEVRVNRIWLVGPLALHAMYASRLGFTGTVPISRPCPLVARSPPSGAVVVPRRCRAPQNFIMMKMFLAAVGVSTLSLGTLSIVAPASFHAARTDFESCCQRLFWWGGALGGALLGAGMATAGACPGMVIAQIGAGVPQALYTVTGCLAGAFAYSALEPWIRAHLRCKHPTAYVSVLARRWLLVSLVIGLCLTTLRSQPHAHRGALLLADVPFLCSPSVAPSWRRYGVRSSTTTCPTSPLPPSVACSV